MILVIFSGLNNKIIAFFSSRHLAYALLGIISTFCLYILYHTEGYFGGADDISHYNISRYAFKYPYLFFDMWGKPVFTFCSTIFAQFGYRGIMFYNLLAGLLTSILAYEMLRKRSLSAWMTMALLVFSPIYFQLLFTSLTEPTFGLFVVLSLFFFQNNKYLLSAIIISFLPFARMEGFAFLPLFALVFAYLRQWKSIPALAAGTIIIVGSGFLYHGDLAWFIKDLPFGKPAIDVYGRGDFLHFIREYKWITGSLLALAFIAGILISLISIVINKRNKVYISFTILLVGMVLIFIGGHSYAWWIGSSGSLGLLRVMGAIVPLIIIIVVDSWGFLRSLLPFSMGMLLIFFEILFVCLHISIGINTYDVPCKAHPKEVLMKDVSRYLSDNGFDDSKVYYYDIFVLHALGQNPFEKGRCVNLPPGASGIEEKVGVGDVLIWDANTSPNEGKLPLDSMLCNQYFNRIKDFQPKFGVIALNGYSYEIILFQRNNRPHNLFIKDSLHFFNQYEMGSKDSLTSARSLSGKYSTVLSPKSNSTGYFRKYSDFYSEDLLRIKVEADIFTKNKFDDFSLVISYQENGKDTRFIDIKNYSLNITENEWSHVSLEIMAPALISRDHELRTYIAYHGENELLVDDFKVFLRYERSKRFGK